MSAAIDLDSRGRGAGVAVAPAQERAAPGERGGSAPVQIRFATRPVEIVPAGDEACRYEYSYDDLFTERLRAAGQPVTHLQVPLPPEYVSMAPADLDARIAAAKAALGG